MVRRNPGRKYAIIGFPWDMGASLGRPGARYAPKAIRDSLKWILNRIKNGKVFDVESSRVVDLSQITIRDIGDVEIFAHDVLKTFNTAYKLIKDLVNNHFRPIIMGGDHSITYPCVRALHDSVEGSIGIVQFDAHLDQEVVCLSQFLLRLSQLAVEFGGLGLQLLVPGRNLLILLPQLGRLFRKPGVLLRQLYRRLHRGGALRSRFLEPSGD